MKKNKQQAHAGMSFSYSLYSCFFPIRYLLAVSFNPNVMTSSWWEGRRSLWRSCAVEPAVVPLGPAGQRRSSVSDWVRAPLTFSHFLRRPALKKGGLRPRLLWLGPFFYPPPPRSRWPDGYCGDKSNFRGEDKAGRRLEGQSNCPRRSSLRTVAKEIHAGVDVSYLGIFVKHAPKEKKKTPPGRYTQARTGTHFFGH